jgi:hypothetical protein
MDIIGKTFWFEYHCDESKASNDYHLFLRSHSKVKVLSRSQDNNDEYPDEPKCFEIEFEDGFKCTVFDDELMNSQKEFYRPNPPEKILN